MAALPVSLVNDLQNIPGDRTVTLLMRHSARHPIIDPAQPYVAMLTEEGVRLAEELGEILGALRTPGRLMSAPVDRCRDTAAAIARGAGWPDGVTAEVSLSHPFIEPAWEMLSGGKVNGTLPPQVHATLNLMLNGTGREPVLDLAVTHDTILGAVVGSLLKAPVMGEFWPGFLEGVFTWQNDGRAYFLWRGKKQSFDLNYWLLGK